MIKTKMIQNGYTAREALLLLLHTDPNLNIDDIQEVYYPYVRFRYLVTVGKRNKLGRLDKYSDCSVDRVSGSVYVSEGEPVFEEIEIYEEDALETVTPMNECYDIAHDFTLKMYLSKAKLLMTPELQIIEEDSFHKKFYIVTCLDENDQPYFIMVDAVDGGISVLDHEKYVEYPEPLIEDDGACSISTESATG